MAEFWCVVGNAESLLLVVGLLVVVGCSRDPHPNLSLPGGGDLVSCPVPNR